jgi:uncharacterized protein
MDSLAPSTEPVSRTPTATIVRPLLHMRWEALTYLHWAVAPEVVAATLPAGLVPDVHGGHAYVGLIPFRMAGIGLGGRGVPLPWSTFPETNVRTYVIGPDGGRGVYFHSLDITRLVPTAVARLGYRLPYCFSRMRVSRRGDLVGYLARRRWPGADGGASHVVVEIGAPLAPGSVTALDDFLSARWSLYAVAPRGAVLRTRVEHAPWPLREARLLTFADDLLHEAGYDLAERAPDHVRYGGDVEVTVGAPRRVG